MSWEDVLKVQLRKPSSMQGANTQAINRFYDNQMNRDIQAYVDGTQREGKIPNFSIMVNTKQPNSGMKRGRLGATYIIGNEDYVAMGSPNPERIYETLSPKFRQSGFEPERGLRGGIAIKVPKEQRKDIRQRNPGMMGRAYRTLQSRLPGR